MEFRGPKALVNLHGGRQTLPWDYFRVARHQGTSPQITDERWTYDKKCGVSLSYVPFPRSLLPFSLVKEGEQLGIDLVFQGRAHAVRPAGNDLELGAAPFTSLAEGSAESVTQHSPAFRHEGRELALKPFSCTAAPALSDRR